MRARSPWWILGSLALALAVVLAAGYAGWLGPLVTCGADGATVCIAWPGVASAVTWLIFIGTLACLVAWQARDWRSTSVARREVVWLGIVCWPPRWSSAPGGSTWRRSPTTKPSAASLVAAWHFQGLFPLTGIISSVGVPNPPAWPYLLAIALLPLDSPYALVGLGISGRHAAVAADLVGRPALDRPVGRAGRGHLLCQRLLGEVSRPRRLATGFPAGAGHPVPGRAAGAGRSTLALGTGHRVRLAGGDGAAALHRRSCSPRLVPLAAWPARRALRPVHVVAAALRRHAAADAVLAVRAQPAGSLARPGSACSATRAARRALGPRELELLVDAGQQRRRRRPGRSRRRGPAAGPRPLGERRSASGFRSSASDCSRRSPAGRAAGAGWLIAAWVVIP